MKARRATAPGRPCTPAWITPSSTMRGSTWGGGLRTLSQGVAHLVGAVAAGALVDRLLHHAHILVTEGDSIRRADATAGKGVTPLPT